MATIVIIITCIYLFFPQEVELTGTWECLDNFAQFVLYKCHQTCFHINWHLLISKCESTPLPHTSENFQLVSILAIYTTSIIPKCLHKAGYLICIDGWVFYGVDYVLEWWICLSLTITMGKQYTFQLLISHKMKKTTETMFHPLHM